MVSLYLSWYHDNDAIILAYLSRYCDNDATILAYHSRYRDNDPIILAYLSRYHDNDAIISAYLSRYRDNDATITDLNNWYTMLKFLILETLSSFFSWHSEILEGNSRFVSFFFQEKQKKF